MIPRIPTTAERSALIDSLTLDAVGTGINTVAALAGHLGVCERSVWRYLDRLEARGVLTSEMMLVRRRLDKPPRPARVWKLAEPVGISDRLAEVES